MCSSILLLTLAAILYQAHGGMQVLSLKFSLFSATGRRQKTDENEGQGVTMGNS